MAKKTSRHGLFRNPVRINIRTTESRRFPIGLIILALVVLFGAGMASNALREHTSPTKNTFMNATWQKLSDSKSTKGSASSSSSASSHATEKTGKALSFLSGFFGDTASHAFQLSGNSLEWMDADASNRPLDESVTAGSREKFTVLHGDGSDRVTVMLYMCGSDLESKSGMATADLSELVSAVDSEQVHLVIYTGGTRRWRNQIVNAEYNQIYTVQNGKLKKLLGNDGQRQMTSPTTLTGFINYCNTHFPANRRQLILWDHGGGSVSGFGYDEKFVSRDSMELPELRKAIQDSGVTFDFIGLDAGLMATAETALSLSDLADYLIASEETEPGTGWDYSDWIRTLSENPSLPTTELGKKMIDDYISFNEQHVPGQKASLSLIDLAELSHTFPKRFSAFSKELSSFLSTNRYPELADARNRAREFSDNAWMDHIDLSHFAGILNTGKSKALAKVIKHAVKYNRTTKNLTNAYGLSVYFPYRTLSHVDTMLELYRTLSWDPDYSEAMQSFAVFTALGQMAGQHNGASEHANPVLAHTVFSNASFTKEEWQQWLQELREGATGMIPGLTEENSDFLKTSGYLSEERSEDLYAVFQKTLLHPSELSFTETEEKEILHLEEEEWKKVGRIELRLLYHDGHGYIDLGHDCCFKFTEKGDLIGDFDGNWISLNGQPVMYHHLDTLYDGEGNRIMESGYIPCMLNGIRTRLMVTFDQAHPDGYLAGTQTDYAKGETATVAKIIPNLQNGDRLDFICDYYLTNGRYEDNYYVGDEFVVSDPSAMEIGTIPIQSSTIISFVFTDLYGNRYWTAGLHKNDQ